MLDTVNRYTHLSSVRWIIAFSYTLVMVVLLVQQAAKPVLPVGVPPGPPSLKRELLFAGLHVFFFALMTFIWRWTLIERASPMMALGLAVFITLFVGFTTEFAQTLIADRTASVGDLSANVLGALIVVVWTRWRVKVAVPRLS